MRKKGKKSMSKRESSICLKIRKFEKNCLKLNKKKSNFPFRKTQKNYSKKTGNAKNSGQPKRKTNTQMKRRLEEKSCGRLKKKKRKTKKEKKSTCIKRGLEKKLCGGVKKKRTRGKFTVGLGWY